LSYIYNRISDLDKKVCVPFVILLLSQLCHGISRTVAAFYLGLLRRANGT